MLNDKLEILGARTHNLQNISLSVPRNSLITITGLSGSGKSSLAFDTIYAEGQRRYLETFSSYIRNFIGNIGRPDVDKITGLSPVISIEQKTTNKNPRSTVGTTTEIYDLLRLLFARISQAYSINTGEKMVKYSEKQIIQEIESCYNDSSIIILAPVVKGRKGHYRELFESITKKGFLKVRIDGKIENLVSGLRVDRYKVHDIEIVIDKLKISSNGKQERLKKSIETAFKHGKNSLMIIDENEKIRHFSRLLMCPTTGISYPEPEPNTFSFNSPYGACPFCNGLGEVTQVEIDKIIPDRKKSIANGGLIPIGKPNMNSWFVKQISQIGLSYDFSLDTAFEDYTEQALNVLLYGECKDSAMPNDFKGVVNFIASQFNEESVPASIQKWAASFMSNKTCPHCNGRRLKEESLHFRIGDKNIADLANMDLTELSQWCIRIEEFLSPREKEIASEILREINTKINFLLDVGLGYLSLNRSTRSLSGGESQRIRLATQIGSKLVNVMYILDEPSIGLHQTDNIRLIESLKRLRDLGNTVIVVEHDKDMMLASDYIIDIGPGAGINGGQLTAIGSPKDILNQNSITCQYLKGEKKIPIPETRREGNGKHIHLYGACGNNLKNVNLDIPLGMLVCVTGVSGSGKSSLINDTLHPILSNLLHRSEKAILPYKSIEGIENIDKVIEINQAPIGKTPRSNPATFIGVFDEIRKLYASLPTAKIRNYPAGRFSFNVKGGRCEECQGAGIKTIEMNFLPEVYVTCPECGGKRYNRETLEVRYKGKSINDVLNMSFSDALTFFENYPKIKRQLSVVVEVGLGYLTLGQPSTTLSGGECQRIKLATELSKKDTGNTLYILDEPTTGLHFEDIRILLEVLQKLIDKGNSMIIIEHNLDVIKVADYIIDMGSKGGKAGGMIAESGTPEQLALSNKNSIGTHLQSEL
ncbi:MAG: excinuclease ABC subunit UvrA [Bacteroidales bacterium]|nr:excinuclease ABC subunit UvrA [Bacteroidales bacterium]MEE0961168.1 excinuclease ABC subunit UvrA [Bacteroidales bacterium]